MAVPKKRTSKSKRDKRRSHDALTVTASQECTNCGELRKPHNLCKHCGHYDGRQVFSKSATSEAAGA